MGNTTTTYKGGEGGQGGNQPGAGGGGGGCGGGTYNSGGKGGDGGKYQIFGSERQKFGFYSLLNYQRDEDIDL